MSPMNRRFILTLSLDAYASQRMNNIGSLIRLSTNVQRLEQASENIEGRFSAGTARIKRVADARERLRVAVGIFDIIDQAFKNSNNEITNHKYIVRKEFQNIRHKINNLNRFSWIICFNSDFRNDCSMLTTMDSNAHYDAYHGLQRAIEEFPMLKDNAASVIKHGKDIVSKLEVVVNVLLPDDMQGRDTLVIIKHICHHYGTLYAEIYVTKQEVKPKEKDYSYNNRFYTNYAKISKATKALL
ncbi:hypothetical protein BDC45DRAFT_542583 [Circinella umbellata]|nr:hypothetical protein BDC45DRAFT_542583 [Circinella umbellata]